MPWNSILRPSNWKSEPPTLWPIINKHTEPVKKFIMACTEVQDIGQNSLPCTLKSKDLATRAFPKNSRHTLQNPLNLSPVQKGQRTPCKTGYAFPRSPLGYRVSATNLLPLAGPKLKPTTQTSSLHENGRGLECRFHCSCMSPWGPLPTPNMWFVGDYSIISDWWYQVAINDWENNWTAADLVVEIINSTWVTSVRNS